jgi:hypothetical protein
VAASVSSCPTEPAIRDTLSLRKSQSHILAQVSARLDPSWSVLASPSTAAVDRCVDVFVRPDGSFGFEEFRRDPEDMGAWTPVAYYSTTQFKTEADAVSAARDAVSWLPSALDGRSDARPKTI